jgi:periplasmic protein TonB
VARRSFDKQDQRNSKIVTALFHILLLFLFFFVGLQYMDPPPEDGIAINFGYDADGFGNSESAPTETAVTQPNPQTQQQETTDSPDEEVITQEVEEAPAIAKPTPTTTPKKPEPTKPVEAPKPTETKPDPKPSNALSSALKSSQSGKGAGEGETQGGGDQGDPNGDPNSTSREGAGGTGSGGNYRLGNRQALQRPKPEYDCPAQGRVVVAVYVNREGVVVEAVPGERVPNGPSSNTSNQCLFDKARDAALKTRWQGDPNAVERQKGYIIYDFSKN